MPDIENLDALSSGELHDRAVKLAVSRGDVKFLWELLREIPAAKTAAGDPRGGQDDIFHVTALIRDFITAGEGDVAEGLRPVYLDYLSNTGD